MSYIDKYKYWLQSEAFDAKTRRELAELDDESEIEDRFYKDLEFGTGGLRGIMGAGTNRMNRYTVGKAAAGLGAYLRDNSRGGAAAIAFDTRKNSREMAEATAAVLTGMGISVYIFDKPAPTPELSFAVRRLGCAAGAVITASHNPKEYNGFKIYDENGCQLVPRQAERIAKYIDRITDFSEVSFEGNDALKTYIDLTEEFTEVVLAASPAAEPKAKEQLKIVYTPLNGTGNVPVRLALEKAGFKNVYVVRAQEEPNGDFPTLRTPNPEDRAALELGIGLAEAVGADIVLGTDPDCDRVGAGIRTADGYELLTGNQIGALLADYVISKTDLAAVKNPAIAKTVVTSELGAEIAKKRGIAVLETLTGFKYIGELITRFEETGEHTFLFGYEESYGYLAGDYARDKDGVGPCILLCNMAAEYKSRDKTPVDRLNELYSEYGFCLDAQDSVILKGRDGAKRIADAMTELRDSVAPLGGTLIDYSKGIGGLPKSNVIKISLPGGSWFAVRPSGTEPKLKIYYSIRAKDKKSAERELERLREELRGILSL